MNARMMNNITSTSEIPVSRPFRIVFIKPSHYDDQGYVIRWRWSCVPSNTLACLYGITQSIQNSKELGPGIELIVDVYDETNQKIPVKKIVRQLSGAGPKAGIICLAGVQSNQYPRAIDLARLFRAEGIDVLIGGFHVSGCISMLEKLPEDLKTAIDEGITLIAGEVEEHWIKVLSDALNGQLKTLYNFMDDLPPLQGQAAPILPLDVISRYVGNLTTFDAGRGCPFECSFCTIINVQGRKSRGRDADDIERIIRENDKRGITRYFITDDDFARNRNWEVIFDRIILLRERDGIKISFTLQVDTACHRLPRFIEKAGKAGCTKVFFGMESVNPESLKATGKRQNHVEEYRELLQEWRKTKAMTYAGYIIGFPNDTYESVMRDVEVLKNDLPLDLVEFFILTPLPGSEDHQTLVKNNIWMDPDMNKYDTEHPCVKHSRMSEEEWIRTYQAAWKSFYTYEHIKTIFRRRWAEGHSVGKIMGQIIWFCGAVFIEKVHPLQAGIIRMQARSELRPGLPPESFLGFAWRRFREVIASTAKVIVFVLKLHFIRREVQREYAKGEYIDKAITPVTRRKKEDIPVTADLSLSLNKIKPADTINLK